MDRTLAPQLKPAIGSARSISQIWAPTRHSLRVA